MICKEELVRRFDDYVRYFNAYCTSDVENHEMLKAVLAMLKEQEKPNGKCVNECECWDSAYERGKQDALKEQEELIPVSWLKEKLEGHPELPYAVTDGINNVLDLWEGR